MSLQLDAEKAPVTFEANELLHSNMQAFIATIPTTFIAAPAAAAEGAAAVSASAVMSNKSFNKRANNPASSAGHTKLSRPTEICQDRLTSGRRRAAKHAK